MKSVRKEQSYPQVLTAPVQREAQPRRRKSKMTETSESDTPVVIQKLLTVSDVSAILGLSKVTIYELIKKGGLPTLKINGARRIQPSKLKTWIEQHSEE